MAAAGWLANLLLGGLVPLTQTKELPTIPTAEQRAKSILSRKVMPSEAFVLLLPRFPAGAPQLFGSHHLEQPGLAVALFPSTNLRSGRSDRRNRSCFFNQPH